MARLLDLRQILGPGFAIARIQSPPGYYVELELDILDQPVHRFFRDHDAANALESARAFRDSVFDSLSQDWLQAVLIEFERLRELRRGTGIRRTTTASIGYWGFCPGPFRPGRHPRRTYSAARYTEAGARSMALFARAQENVRITQPWLLEVGPAAVHTY